MDARWLLGCCWVVAFTSAICFITVKTVQVIENSMYGWILSWNLNKSYEVGLRSWKNGLRNSNQTWALEVCYHQASMVQCREVALSRHGNYHERLEHCSFKIAELG